MLLICLLPESNRKLLLCMWGFWPFVPIASKCSMVAQFTVAAGLGLMEVDHRICSHKPCIELGWLLQDLMNFHWFTWSLVLSFLGYSTSYSMIWDGGMGTCLNNPKLQSYVQFIWKQNLLHSKGLHFSVSMHKTVLWIFYVLGLLHKLEVQLSSFLSSWAI